MAESQLMVLDDGRIGARIPESKPEFYYSEEQRIAIEELLKNGDGAFKTRLKDEKMTDFLSAREVKMLVSSFTQYDTEGESSNNPTTETHADSGVHSTYWPEMSDTEVPSLEIGWPSGGLFKGVTRVAVHTHPPKDNGPHLKEVARRLIQEASKVIAIVMDLLTDVQILQDLMDAACQRSVPVYILLDRQGVPHFLDMCSRLQIGVRHLLKIRTRILQGIGFCLSFGKFPGSLCNKYMLVDGDKVMFGSYSFSWCTSRMDRNMITVMTGQVVDSFDRDFRELYAVSEKLDLYKEFHISQPDNTRTATVRSKLEPKRPPLPATTSRFQVSLGDSQNTNIQVPAHKYYNPKYSLLLESPLRPTMSLQELGPKINSLHPVISEDMDEGRPRVTSSVRVNTTSPVSEAELSESLPKAKQNAPEKSWKATWKRKTRKNSVKTPPSTGISATDETEDSLEINVPRSKASRKLSKLEKKASLQTVNTAQDNESTTGKSRLQGKPSCKVS
ncbi:protein FAM83F isoform X2 [Oryzias melastigma]|uniref:Family with sequence similarity 83 member Fb n=1 Tax=Oryzias melastigma TaxID=30732 RepID=A0A3B3DP66_ORYME|nr:protein FAM83F isoform X2 [Oryzias melastigma]